MKIGLDIMSGDNAPLSNINGAIRYINNPKSNNNLQFKEYDLKEMDEIIYELSI